MAVRFIEYIHIDGKQVGLYIKQENMDNCKRCFRIQVCDVKKVEFTVCKNGNTSWQIVTQNNPEYILQNLFSFITSVIKKRLDDESNYLSPY